MSWYPSHSPVPLANDNIGLTLNHGVLSFSSLFSSLPPCSVVRMLVRRSWSLAGGGLVCVWGGGEGGAS